MNAPLLFFLTIISCSHSLSATMFASGNAAFPKTFTAPINTEVFDRATGRLYVGLGQSSITTPTGAFALSVAPRILGDAYPTFFGMVSSGILNNANIVQLALSTLFGQPAFTLAGYRQSGTDATVITRVFAVNVNGTVASPTVQSAQLLDAGGGLDDNGFTTAGIVNITASFDYIFAAVQNNAGDPFGAQNSGIAVVSIDRNNDVIHTLTSLTQTAAVAGDMGIKAQRFDDSTIAGVPGTPALFINNAGLITANAVLFWDNQLLRLYAGASLTSSAVAGSGARSVVVGRIQDDTLGILDYSFIAPNSAITPNLSAAENEIVAGIQTDGVAFNLSVFDLNTMHTSTGLSYLIVNGGNGDTRVTGPFIFALPLVDMREADGDIDPAFEAVHGTLAKNSAPLINGKFQTPAIAPGDLVRDPTLDATGRDAFALVGGTALPIDGVKHPSDITVVGDTVFVALNIPQSATDETGVLYSQAKFDYDGKIIGWTPWAKRGFPFEGLSGLMNPERDKFVEVDAVTGDVWVIGNDSNQTVNVTVWDNGNDPVSLVSQLNTVLCNGTFSVLDLDAFTRGFNGQTPYRYALFGGQNKVIFTVPSTNFNLADLSALSPQFVPQDYTEPEFFFPSLLPPHAGAVNALEYARQISPGQNYFFAGTPTGLYVFANSNGTGFVAGSLSTLDMPPFSTGSWIKAPNIPGSVIDIKTIGNALYVLTYQSSPSAPISSTLYKVNFGTPINSMFAAPTVIAQSNTGIFSGIFYFSSIQLIGTFTNPAQDNSAVEQLVLGTNKGLFQSTRVGGVQAAVSQADAAWQMISSDTSYVRGIAGMDPSLITQSSNFTAGAPHTVWPFTILNPVGNPCTGTIKPCQQAIIEQLNGGTAGQPFALVPTEFVDNAPEIVNISPITAFWTDGARRFFIIKRPENNNVTNTLMSFPYNSLEWATDQFFLTDQALTPMRAFTWIKEIGMSGKVLVGTINGVVALE